MGTQIKDLAEIPLILLQQNKLLGNFPTACSPTSRPDVGSADLPCIHNPYTHLSSCEQSFTQACFNIFQQNKNDLNNYFRNEQTVSRFDICQAVYISEIPTLQSYVNQIIDKSGCSEMYYHKANKNKIFASYFVKHLQSFVTFMERMHLMRASKAKHIRILFHSEKATIHSCKMSVEKDSEVLQSIFQK